MYDDLISLRENIYDFAQSVRQADQDGRLTNSRLDIAGAVIHMFCNRLVGDNTWERKVYALVRHGTHDLSALFKHRR